MNKKTELNSGAQLIACAFLKSTSSNVRRLAVAVATTLVLIVPAPAQTPSLKSVPGYIPPVTATLQPTGTLPAGQVLHLLIGLPFHNPQILSNVLQDIYDPTSIRFHHYLSRAQWKQLFGPTDADYLVQHGVNS